MLHEIYCEQFHQKRIVFNPGLSVVLGSNAGDNSIGKSTFLLIIDYVFGGSTYAGTTDIIENVGSRKYKHDPRNPIGTAIAMLLMPLGLGLLAFNEMGLFPARYDRILLVIGNAINGGAIELATLSAIHVSRKSGRKKDARTGIVVACLVGICFLVGLTCMIFMPFAP